MSFIQTTYSKKSIKIVIKTDFCLLGQFHFDFVGTALRRYNPSSLNNKCYTLYKDYFFFKDKYMKSSIQTILFIFFFLFSSLFSFFRLSCLFDCCSPSPLTFYRLLYYLVHHLLSLLFPTSPCFVYSSVCMSVCLSVGLSSLSVHILF